MSTLIDKHLEKIQEIENRECWYIVKQETSFWKQCYYTKMLLDYYEKVKLGYTEELNKYLEEETKILNERIPEKIEANYRAARNSCFYGLLYDKEGKYKTYANYEATEVFKSILEITKGEFEKIELYDDIILNQLEKIFISSKLEKKDGPRKKFKIFPIIFLYKILLELGVATGKFSITEKEYKYFLSVQDNYYNYLNTLTLILESRENEEDFSRFEEYKEKLDNRFNLIIKQLKTIKFENGSYILKSEYVEHVKKLIYNIDKLNVLATEEDYMKLLISNINLENLEKFSKVLKKDYSYQRIFFGAPGTGKSYLLNQEAKSIFKNNFDRVTFHPNYMYGNFIGAFKPFPKKDDLGKEIITYKYVPGPLMKMLVKAFLNPQEKYLLIIEEINRANVSGVFGDFFQLLDRNESGESEYSIYTSEEIQQFFKECFEQNINEIKLNYIKQKLNSDYSKIILPNNLYIWATMNSADQGVMPLDTAFKRRWDFTYMDVDNEKEELFKDYKFKITETTVVEWNKFRKEINKRLSSYNIPEDKLLGPYFISKKILETKDVEKITEAIKDKVLLYLYEDVAKAYRNKLFVSEKAITFSMLRKNFDLNGKDIFNIPLEIPEENI